MHKWRKIVGYNYGRKMVPKIAISLHICLSMVMPSVVVVVSQENHTLLLRNRAVKNYWKILSERHYHDL